MNTCEFIQCLKNDVRVRSMFDKMVFNTSLVNFDTKLEFYQGKKHWRKILWLESPRNPFLDNHTSSKAMFANYLVAKITGLKLSLTISWLWICNNEVWHLSPCLGGCSPCRLDRCLSSFPGSCTFEYILDIMKLDLDSPSQHMHYHVCLLKYEYQDSCWWKITFNSWNKLL